MTLFLFACGGGKQFCEIPTDVHRVTAKRFPPSDSLSPSEQQLPDR